MKIVAFLQNPYFHAGTDPRHIELYASNQRFHQLVLAGTATGKALVKAFGQELYGKIWWDNASPDHGDCADEVKKYDSHHMCRVIALIKPTHVLLFGRMAQRGWDELIARGYFNTIHSAIEAPAFISVHRARHPMAMGSSREHLKTISDEIKRLNVQADFGL